MQSFVKVCHEPGMTVYLRPTMQAWQVCFPWNLDLWHIYSELLFVLWTNVEWQVQVHCHMCTAQVYSAEPLRSVLYGDGHYRFCSGHLAPYMRSTLTIRQSVHQCINMHNHPFKECLNDWEWMIKNEWDAWNFTAVNESKQGRHLQSSKVKAKTICKRFIWK